MHSAAIKLQCSAHLMQCCAARVLCCTADGGGHREREWGRLRDQLICGDRRCGDDHRDESKRTGGKDERGSSTIQMREQRAEERKELRDERTIKHRGPERPTS